MHFCLIVHERFNITAGCVLRLFFNYKKVYSPRLNLTTREETIMRLTCTLSIEEDIAFQLASLALRLHRCGLSGPCKKVVRARDALLVILDERMENGIPSERQAKGVVCVDAKQPTDDRVPSGGILPSRETHRSECAAV